jgi:PAS domain-containing protein
LDGARHPKSHRRKTHGLLGDLAESAKRFRTMVEVVPYAMVIFNAGGRIEMVNAQVTRIFG